MKTLRDVPVSRAFPARMIRVEHPDGPLTLRPTLMTDADEIVRAIEASLPELRRFMPWAHAPGGLREQLTRLRAVEADYFAGRDLVMGLFRGDQMLAMAGLHARVPLNPAALEVGYWAPTPHAGRGWTTLAVQALALYAIDRLGCDRLQVMCDEANLASRRVIEKCGFAFEGTLGAMTAAPGAALLAAGLVNTGRNPMFALFPGTLEALSWVAPLRARLTYFNLAGHEVARGSGVDAAPGGELDSRT